MQNLFLIFINTTLVITVIMNIIIVIKNKNQIQQYMDDDINYELKKLMTDMKRDDIFINKLTKLDERITKIEKQLNKEEK